MERLPVRSVQIVGVPLRRKVKTFQKTNALVNIFTALIGSSWLIRLVFHYESVSTKYSHCNIPMMKLQTNSEA